MTAILLAVMIAVGCVVNTYAEQISCWWSGTFTEPMTKAEYTADDALENGRAVSIEQVSEGVVLPRLVGEPRRDDGLQTPLFFSLLFFLFSSYRSPDQQKAPRHFASALNLYQKDQYFVFMAMMIPPARTSTETPRSIQNFASELPVSGPPFGSKLLPPSGGWGRSPRSSFPEGADHSPLP